MPATYRNRLVTAISNTPGTSGALTIAAAAPGYRTFVAADDGLSFDVSIVDGTDWEIRTGCVYTHAGTSLSRGTLEDSSTGAAIALTSAAVVTVTMSAGMGNAMEMVAQVFGRSEIAITGTSTATMGRMHVCSGTSADYTVTLPPASGNAGKILGVRMSAALIKLVTLAGNGSELIDGVQTRVMWATEVAILLCDGTGWMKVAGKTVAMAAGIYRAVLQTSVVSATVSKINCSTLDFDNSGLMADTANSRITVKRPGVYAISGKVQGDNTGAVSRWITLLMVNAAQVGSGECAAVAGSSPTPTAARTQSLSAGDQVELYVYHNAGAAKQVAGSSGKESQINIFEVPSW